MARHAITRQKLRCRDGHWEWADWELFTTTDIHYGLIARCDLGDHFLAQHLDGRLFVQMHPYDFLTPQWAFEARDRWEQQEAGAHPEETEMTP